MCVRVNSLSKFFKGMQFFMELIEGSKEYFLFNLCENEFLVCF